MYVGLLHDGADSNKVNAIFLGVWMRSHPSVGDSDLVPQSCRLNWHDGRRKAQAISRTNERLRQKVTYIAATNQALSGSNLPSIQHEGQGTHLQERRPGLNRQEAHLNHTQE